MLSFYGGRDFGDTTDTLAHISRTLYYEIPLGMQLIKCVSRVVSYTQEAFLCTINAMKIHTIV